MSDRLRLRLGVVALLPAAGWFLLVVLRWFGVTERFEVLQSTIEGSGAALVRGVILFIVCPLLAAALGAWTVRRGERRTAGTALTTVGVALAVLNVVTRNTGL